MTPKILTEYAFAVVATVVLLAIPGIVHSPAFLDFMIRVAAMALFATSLNLLVGGTGMVSFGHGLFYGLGAYAFALLMQRTDLTGCGNLSGSCLAGRFLRLKRMWMAAWANFARAGG